MPKIALVGSNGVIGNALSERLLPQYDVVPIDLPDIDACDARQMDRALQGVDTVIHLAGIFVQENWRTQAIDPRNALLLNSALQAAIRAGAQQFVHASSIHVEDSVGYMQTHGPSEMLVAKPREFVSRPASGYGLAKRIQELVVGQSSCNFISGAVSIRFGAVQADNMPISKDDDPTVREHTRRVWLDHADQAALISSIIQNPTKGFTALYAVSDNTGRFHDVSNPFGWHPYADSAAVLERETASKAQFVPQ